jgi:hypothetical protein
MPVREPLAYHRKRARTSHLSATDQFEQARAQAAHNDGSGAVEGWVQFMIAYLLHETLQPRARPVVEPTLSSLSDTVPQSIIAEAKAELTGEKAIIDRDI